MRTASMLNMFVVAEGGERPEEVEFLRNQGIRLFQGFLFAKPVIGRLITAEEIPWPTPDLHAHRTSFPLICGAPT